MTVQIDPFYRRQARWGTQKALAVLLASVAAISGVILTVAHFLPAPDAPP